MNARQLPTGDVWTPAQIAARWSITAENVTEMCRTGRIPGAFKAGRAWRVSTEALTRYERGEVAA